MKIAYQGEPGAFSEAAARRIDHDAPLIPCRSFEDAFDTVVSGAATHACLPFENSIGGSIHRNYDLLLEHDLPVVAEVLLQVSHNLLAFPGTNMFWKTTSSSGQRTPVNGSSASGASIWRFRL